MTICPPAVVWTAAVRTSGRVLLWGAILVWIQSDRTAEAQAPAGQTPGPARSAMDPALAAKLSQLGDLSLSDTSLPVALFSVSQLWKINIVVGQEVQGQVNGAFRQAPLHEILDAILLSNGYGYRPVGRSLVVMKLADLGDLNPMFRTASIFLKHIDPSQLTEGAALLSSPQGKVLAIPSVRTLMVLDFPDRVEMVRRFAEQVDAAAGRTAAVSPTGEAGQLAVAHFAPQHTSATSLKESVEAVLSQQGKAAAVDSDNRLIVADYEPHLALARQVVQQLDVPRRQVRITALIYDLDIRDMQRLGINWNHALKGRPKTLLDAEDKPYTVPQSIWNVDSFLSVPVSVGMPDTAMTFSNLSHAFDITAVVRALQEAKDSRLLADPNVTVLDHEKALMSIVTEIPYQQLTQTQQGGNIGTTAFKEAGVKLEVTPHIADDGTIRMEVSPSFSRLAGFTPGEQAQPIIDRREAQTTVRVTDRQVLVIGGLRQRNDTGDFNGLPYLKDINFLNLKALFRGRDTELRESELIVFIMPEIVATAHVGAYREEAALQSGESLLGMIPLPSGGPPPYRPQQHHPMTPIGGLRPSSMPYPRRFLRPSAVEFPAPPMAGPYPADPAPLPAQPAPTHEPAPPPAPLPPESAAASKVRLKITDVRGLR